MKKENKNQKAMMIVIRDFDLKNNRLPEIEEICSITGKKEVAVKRVLSGMEIYPKDMLLTKNEKLVKKIYREGLHLNDLSRMTGINESTLSTIMGRLGEKGIINYTKRTYRKQENLGEYGDKKPFLEVEGGPYDGCRGYIKEYGVYAICDLYKNDVFIEDAKVHRDYVKEIRGKA